MSAVGIYQAKAPGTNIVPFGAYSPDTSDYGASTVHAINNVIPRADGYGPWASFAAATQALFAACRGAFYAIKADGTVQAFAGTSNALYELNNTDFSWKPVSRTAACSISNASPGVVTIVNTFVANEPVVFAAGAGTLPAQIVAGTVYYVSATGLSGASFSVSATAGGATINTSGGSGNTAVTSHYTALSSNAQWTWGQFGSKVYATQANDKLQVFDMSSATQFSDNSGSTGIQAAYVAVVGRFLVLSGLLANPYRIQWSALGDPTGWTSGTSSSDFQDFSDGGLVRGVAGGEFGTVFQDQAIRRMAYIPGSSLIFQIERVTQDMGLYAPYSIVRSGPSIFFYSNQGFQKIDPGGMPEPIGREKVDRTFLNDLDNSQPQLFIGSADPRTSRVYWAYKSGAGASGLYDKILGYDKLLDRWFTITISGEYLVGLSQAGVTLESLNTISSSLDALTLSLDAYATIVQPEIASFDSNNKQGFFRGSNLEATLETAEQLDAPERLMINGFRPITDAGTLYGSCSFRETQQVPATAGTEIVINSRTGMCDMRQSTRYSRFKIRIPAGTSWSFAAGVEPDVADDGQV